MSYLLSIVREFSETLTRYCEGKTHSWTEVLESHERLKAELTRRETGTATRPPVQLSRELIDGVFAGDFVDANGKHTYSGGPILFAGHEQQRRLRDRLASVLLVAPEPLVAPLLEEPPTETVEPPTEPSFTAWDFICAVTRHKIIDRDVKLVEAYIRQIAREECFASASEILTEREP